MHYLTKLIKWANGLENTDKQEQKIATDPLISLHITKSAYGPAAEPCWVPLSEKELYVTFCFKLLGQGHLIKTKQDCEGGGDSQGDSHPRTHTHHNMSEL